MARRSEPGIARRENETAIFFARIVYQEYDKRPSINKVLLLAGGRMMCSVIHLKNS